MLLAGSRFEVVEVESKLMVWLGERSLLGRRVELARRSRFSGISDGDGL